MYQKRISSSRPGRPGGGLQLSLRLALPLWVVAQATGGPSLAASAPGPAPWDVRTSIESLRFIDDRNEQGVSSELARPVKVSPDGAYFLAVTSRGDLETDENVDELRVWSTAQVLADLRRGRTSQPLRTVVRRSPNSMVAISRAHWVPGENRVVFTSTGPGRERGGAIAFGLDVLSGRLIQLSEPFGGNADVLAWRGDTALLNGLYNGREEPAIRPYPASVVTRENLDRVAGAGRPVSRTEHGIFLSRNGERRLLVPDVSLRHAWLSPDGGHAVIVTKGAVRPTPEAWRGYANGRGRLSRFQLLELASGEIRPILDAPLGNATTAGRDGEPDVLWSADGRIAILVNTALPLEGAPGDRVAMSYVASYDLGSGRISPVTPFAIDGQTVAGVAWEADGGLRVDYGIGERAQARRFARGEAWTPSGPARRTPPRLTWTQAEPACWDNRCPTAAPRGAAEPLRFSNGLSVLLEEGVDRPPRLVASAGGRSVALVDRDPRLASVAIARSQIVEWTAPDGQVERGLLTLPPGTSTPDRLPLVVQIYAYMPNQFSPNGPTTSPFAAQALAARGIAVLGLPLSSFERPSTMGAPAEGQAMIRSIDGFVETLASRGFIDRERVGVTGFSRSGFMTLYAATHPGATPVRAYFAADAYLGSFSTYVYQVTMAGPEAVDEDERINVGPSARTFWQDRQSWLANSPEFNLDRIRGAVLYTMNYTGSVGEVAARQLLGGFGRTRRPFELVNFPLGVHPLMRPRERFESQSTMVDWMAFWLKDEAPADAERAARWTRMRADWQRQQAWEAAGNLVGSTPPADFAAPPTRQ